MALYVLFKSENTYFFHYYIWLLLNLQMCQIILPDPVHLVAIMIEVTSRHMECTHFNSD